VVRGDVASLTEAFDGVDVVYYLQGYAEVMHDHDIDAVITPPSGGLTSYRDAVTQALRQDGTASNGGRRHLLRFSSAEPQ
jgi:hypothetical protein